MKLKDKKIEILEKTYTHDAIGNSKVSWEPVAPPIWAYFRQLSMKEVYGVMTQVDEEVVFQVNYNPEITTAHVIRFRGILYEITRIDVYEGYKADLKLYCRRRA